MALPSSRNRTYVASDPVRSQDLNDMQDCIIGKKHGTRTMILPAASGIPVDASAVLAGWNFVRSVGGSANYWNSPASGESVIFPIPLDIGCRILAVRARIQDTTGSHTVSMKLHKNVISGSDLNTGSSQVGATQTSAGNGNVQTLTLSGLTETIATLVNYCVHLVSDDGTTTTHKVAAVEIDYDTP